jgi:transcriptional regulator with XRE-family HTH domain
MERELLERVAGFASGTMPRSRRARPDRTVGRATLLRALEHVSQRDVAARVHVTPGAVSLWTSGARRPLRDERALLAAVYGISSDSWDRTITKGEIK